MEKTEKPSFEDLFAQLEEAIRRLETGDIGLGESLTLFERATRLADQCNAILDSAELQVRQLIERNGEMDTELFEGWQDR